MVDIANFKISNYPFHIPCINTATGENVIHVVESPPPPPGFSLDQVVFVDDNYATDFDGSGYGVIAITGPSQAWTRQDPRYPWEPFEECPNDFIQHFWALAKGCPVILYLPGWRYR